MGSAKAASKSVQMIEERVPLVAILMGSGSDKDAMSAAGRALAEFGIPFEAHVMSAHRTPYRVHEYVTAAYNRGIRVFIAGAGKSAHLAGVVASLTCLPVLGVPMETADLGGLDSLLSTVQMPPGIPVGTTAVGKAGARNAGLLAVSILAVHDRQLYERLQKSREALAEEVAKSDAVLQQEAWVIGS